MSTQTMANSHRTDHDRTFILRLWREPPAGGEAQVVWRLSLQDTHTQARRGFASLEEFFAYLELFCSDDTGT